MDESDLTPPPRRRGRIYYPDDQNHEFSRLDDEYHNSCSLLHWAILLLGIGVFPYEEGTESCYCGSNLIGRRWMIAKMHLTRD